MELTGKPISQVAQCNLRSQISRQAAPSGTRPFASIGGDRCGPQPKDRGRGGRDRPCAVFAFCSIPVKRLPDRRHSRFKLQRQDGKANDEGGTIAELACDRSAVDGQPDGGPSEGLVGWRPHADRRRGL